ncbi:MAG: DUF3147 family protein [Gallionellaceae bacterium]|nr:DUF3147 family protein [Gallionellaceae bacterium]
MTFLFFKVAITAVLVAAISEIAKRYSGFAALLASLPLTSLLAFIWLHVEAAPPEQIASLSIQVFWLVIPSLALFVLLAVLLRHGWQFWPSLGVACAGTVGLYFLLLPILRKAGVQL